MNHTPDRHLVLHVARRPYTGVWSLMRNLAREQASRPDWDVALGVLHTAAWRERYGSELETLRDEGIACYGCPTPDLPFTVAYPLLIAQWKLTGNRVRNWLADAARRGGHERCTLHCHNAWLSGAYPPVASRGLRTGMVATYHGIAAHRELRARPVRRAVHRYLAQRFLRYGGTLATVDAANIAVAGELFGVAPEQFTAIPNGVPPPTAATTPPEWRWEEGFVVGHVGILNEGKGWRITAQAVDLLRDRGIDVRFVIAGGGPDAERVREWVSSRTRFSRFLGEVPDAASNVMPGLNLLVMPSAGEGMPMAALEAMAASVPVIATNVGGLPEVIAENRNGHLVKRTPSAVAAAIETVATDPEHHAALRHGAQKSFEEQFHIRVTADRYARLYARAMR
jgi:glycosyltransferase involved in cell wall biosynthesis